MRLCNRCDAGDIVWLERLSEMARCVSGLRTVVASGSSPAQQIAPSELGRNRVYLTRWWCDRGVVLLLRLVLGVGARCAAGRLAGAKLLKFSLGASLLPRL